MNMHQAADQIVKILDDIYRTCDRAQPCQSRDVHINSGCDARML
jgi:hypothetical protein